jgi:hypothetical protein
MVKPTVIEDIQTYLHDLHRQGLEISFGVVFGSQATGSADDLSDIDLLVVSPQFDIKIDREAINRLWRVAARSDSRIEPIACGKKAVGTGFQHKSNYRYRSPSGTSNMLASKVIFSVSNRRSRSAE